VRNRTANTPKVKRRTSSKVSYGIYLNTETEQKRSAAYPNTYRSRAAAEKILVATGYIVGKPYEVKPLPIEPDKTTMNVAFIVVGGGTAGEFFSNAIPKAYETEGEALSAIRQAFEKNVPGLCPRQEYKVAMFQRVS
jgi:hypothetical protein